MFTVVSYCQGFRLFHPRPRNLSIFEAELDSKWTVRPAVQNQFQQPSTQNTCPCSVSNDNRPLANRQPWLRTRRRDPTLAGRWPSESGTALRNGPFPRLALGKRAEPPRRVRIGMQTT